MSAKQLHSELISNLLARARNEQCIIAFAETLKCKRCGNRGIFRDFPTARWLPCTICGRPEELEYRINSADWANGEIDDDSIPF